MNQENLDVVIVREAPVGLHNFTDYFKGFETVDAVRPTFGAETEPLLRELKVEWVTGEKHLRLLGTVGLRGVCS